jgi:hypothetical protein
MPFSFRLDAGLSRHCKIPDMRMLDQASENREIMAAPLPPPHRRTAHLAPSAAKDVP